MKLSSIDIGAPFVLDDRVFYKLYPRFPDGRTIYIKYQCYEVVKGRLMTPPFMIEETAEVEPYVFKKDIQK